VTGRLALVLALVLAASPAAAHEPTPAFLEQVGVTQRLGQALPRDVILRGESGRTLRFAELLEGPPLVLTFNDYGCHTLCPIALDELARTLRASGLVAGRDMRLVAVSLDPWDTSIQAADVRRAFVARAGQAEGLQFLTADQAGIARLAAAAGIRFVRDDRQDQWVHPAALVVLTPDGRIARYLYGVEHAPRDLRLAVAESSNGRVGTPVDRFLLLCYRWDPAVGRYSAVTLGAVRAGGLLTVAGLGTLLVLLWRRDLRRRGDGR
jgi:protein SCO1/2